MKLWPSKDKVASFSDIMEPIIELYQKCKAEPDKDHEYTGYVQGTFTGATCLQGEHLGEAKTRKYSEEDQGRSLEEQFMSLAFQLGVEQGRRLQIEREKLNS